ncbi:MAG: YibE/F family protein, partial [Oscillospiraceae bacterium]
MPTDKTSKTLKTLAWLITVFASIVLLQVSYFALKDLPKTNVPNQPAVPMKAVITEIVSREDTPYSLDGSSEMSELTITFNARLLDGYRKGETVTAIQSIDGFLPAGSQHEVEKGSRVILLEGYDPTSSYGYTFGDFLRTDILFWLLMAFFIALLIFGHFKGLNTIISLTLTCAAIFMVFIPSILAHQNIYIYSTLTCLYIIIMTLLIVNGYNRKTFVAIAGCFSGVLIAGVLTLIFTNILHTSGVMDDKSLYLANLGSGELDLKGIVFAG